MKGAIYVKVTAAGVFAPTAGTITQIIPGITAGVVFALYLDASTTAAKVQIENPSGTIDALLVIPTQIPVQSGQKIIIGGVNSTCTVEITPQA